MLKIIESEKYYFLKFNGELFARDIHLDTPFTLYLSSLRFTRSNELNSDNIQDFFLAGDLHYL